MAAPSSHSATIALGLIAAPGLATELASELVGHPCSNSPAYAMASPTSSEPS
jgi:hypothetical protein